MKKILIAGASGFIGRALIQELLKDDDIEIVGLSRKLYESDHPRLTWKAADLFSLKDINQAMVGCEEAYYLVHSMLPSATLSQGKFYDYDLILADNFRRAAEKNGLQHIIYLGGMIPPFTELSWHLRSRLEVEETFRFSTIKTTVLRASLIIGPGGSSFTILQRLVERLPIMIAPAWTNTRSQPAALSDILKVLKRSFYDKEVQGRIYDVGGAEVITYQGLILKTTSFVRSTSKIYTLNIIPLWLSRWWVTFITGVPKNLVYPLVLSLKHEMLVQSGHVWPYPEDLQTPLDVTLKEALVERPGPRPRFAGHLPKQNDVRSIQRLVLPPGRDADWAANEYFRWLPQFFSTLIRVKLEGDRAIFYLFNPSIQILILEISRERSAPDRMLMYVVGGILSGVQDRGRLEFREVLNRRYVLSALHEFRPSLPWWIYRWTQAIVHTIVMYAFGEHLKWVYLTQKRFAK